MPNMPKYRYIYAGERYYNPDQRGVNHHNQKIDKMIKDLEIRGRTPNTIKNMVWSLKNFSKFYNQPPELLVELVNN
jgi:hypothetical protein